VVAPSRATAAGLPARLLVSTWREAAETAAAACLLTERDGVMQVGWVNRALGDLLGVDSAELAGRSVHSLIESDAGRNQPQEPAEQPGQEPGQDPAEDAGPEPSAAAGVVPAQRGTADPLVDWAGLAHRFARTGAGRGIGRLQRLDGRVERVQVVVTPIAADSAADPAAGPAAHPAAGPVPGRVTPAGTIGELPVSASPDGWLVRIEPVSDRSAELELRLGQAEHRFAALAGCAPVGIFASEAGLRLGYVNDRFVGLTGLDAHALLGTGWLEAVHRDDLAAIYSAVQTVLAATPVELAVRLAGSGDVQRWMQLRLAPTTTPTQAAGFIGTAEDVTERRTWEEHITYQAQHDPLTGLVNRRRLLEVLHELLSGRRGRDRDFAVLFLDLDGFKSVNDTLGHDAGDRALIEVARRMQRVARETDVLARVAGDEFVVVLRHIFTDAEAEAAARRHLEALRAPFRLGRNEVGLSASIGVALPAGFDTPEALLRAADKVMYEAKSAGHGEYRLAKVAPIGEGA
jgi:diguanylate cyclase (GGDEF)-like protein/PAS domain S-box-containing protein